MLKDYKIVSDVFWTEVNMDLEQKFPILCKVDVPMYMFIEYKKDQDIWECTCRMEPVNSKNVTIVRQYTTEIIESIKELEENANTRENTRSNTNQV